MGDSESLPSFAFVPGGVWPRPSARSRPTTPLADATGDGRRVLLRGSALFNAGFYWEAHELWESLWHAEKRSGPNADVVKGLIKLAAAGVKVRERQPRGVSTHAARAAILFEQVRALNGPDWFGLDLDRLAEFAREIAQKPPQDPAPIDTKVSIVFDYRLGTSG